MKAGDPVLVRGGSHMYPDGWARGQEPTYIRKTLIALVLGDEVESGPVNPRTFLRVLTPHGIGTINSAFCEVVGETR